MDTKHESLSMDEEIMRATASIDPTIYMENINGGSSSDIITIDRNDRKERKGASYVWNYCEKLTRHNIRCKLCMKIMSFHGTANVITHLQRRHNVLGDNVVQTDISEIPVDVLNNFENHESLNHLFSPRKKCKNMTNASVVWKYCTRISQERVRCCLCKKNLSYQGTSNLQRHLHRMHGIVTHGRSMVKLMGKYTNIKKEDIRLSPDLDLLWQFCTQIDCGSKIKCNMCDDVYNNKETEAVLKHLTVIHSVKLNSNNLDDQSTNLRTKKRKPQMDLETSDEGNFDEDYTDSHCSRIDESNELTMELDGNNIKRDDSLYDELIEEDHVNYDEEPFNPSLLQDTPQCNPLSAHSSRDNSPEVFVSLSNQHMQISNQQLLKLQEDRLRSETEYFREKAGYYRMLKYLTALQARKTRVELESSNHNVSNTVNIDELNSSYGLNVTPIPTHMTTNMTE